MLILGAQFLLQEESNLMAAELQEKKSALETAKRMRFRERHLYRSREDLRLLAVHLQEMMEEERTRISRQVHDELGQSLTGFKMDLAWACRKLNEPQDSEDFLRAMERLSELSKDIESTIHEVRRIARELRPGPLDDFGLTAAIEYHISEFERRTGIACFLKHDGKPWKLADPARTEIFRIFQEAMTNVARHAEATQIRIGLAEENGFLLLDVGDNGRGITLQAGSSHSLGLIGMRERAAMLGGILEVSGTSSSGTRVRLHVPLPEDAIQAGGGCL